MGASAWRIRRLAAARAPGRSSRRRPWITVRSPGTARVAAAPPAPGRPLAKAGTTPAARSGAHRCRHRERNHSPVAPAGAIRTRAAAVRWGAPPAAAGRGVVGEDFRLRVFRRQQADQQLVEVETAEQRLAIEQVGNTGAFQAGHGLQFAAPAPLRFQRHEWPRQGASLAAGAAQDRAQATQRGEEVHQGAGFLVRPAMQHVGGLAAAKDMAGRPGARDGARLAPAAGNGQRSP